MRTSAVSKVLIFSLVAIFCSHHGNAKPTTDLEEYSNESEGDDLDYHVYYVDEEEPPRIKPKPSTSSSSSTDPQTPAEDRVFFAPYKFPFWGLPYGIYSNGGFVNPGLFPFVPGGPGFPPYDGIFGGPFGPGAFPGPGLNPFGPGVGTPMGVPTPGLPGGPPLPQPPGPGAPAPSQPSTPPPSEPAPGGGAVATKSKPKPKPKPKRKPKTTQKPYANCGCTKHLPRTTTKPYNHQAPSASPCPLNHNHYETTTPAPYYPPSSTSTEYTTTPAPYYLPPSPPPPPQYNPPSPTLAPIIMMYTPKPYQYRRSHNPAVPPSPSKKPCPYKLRILQSLQPSSPSTTTTTPAPPSSSTLPPYSPSIYLLKSHYPSTLVYPTPSPPSSEDGFVLIPQEELEQLQNLSSSEPEPKKLIVSRRRNLTGKRNKKANKKKLLTFDTYLQHGTEKVQR